MSMVNLAMSEEEKKDRAEPTMIADSPKYPYGLRISLDKDVVDKLNMSKPGLGDKKVMLAKVEVVEVSKSDYRGDADKFRVELQITDLALQDHKEEKKTEDVIYGGENS